MKSISFLLASRYMLHSTSEKTISSMMLICFISIMIGTFSLALVSAVMRGFEATVHEKMQGIHAQAMIQSIDNPLDVKAIAPVLEQEFPEITHWSPYGTAYAIIQSPDTADTMPPAVVMLKGIDPEKERTVSTIEKKITPTAPLDTLIHDNHIVIGKKLAQSLDIHVGMTITILYLDQPTQSRKVTVHNTHAIVSALFDTGIDEIDGGLVLCSHDFLHDLFPDVGITHINLTLAPTASEEDTIERLGNRLSLGVYSWKELYPALVSALKLEKYAMFFILVLITLVASMNIVSLLFMLITQKRPDIAILRAMGLSAPTVTRIFLMIGMLIVTIAASLGLALAWGASWLLEQYPFIELPDVYYVSHLPAAMDWQITFSVFTAVIIISIIATWIPARRARTISIADVLRFEG